MEALYISLIVLFLHSCSWQGMIFGKIQEIVKPETFLYKPLYGCPICMTPWWGTLIYWIFFHITIPNWILTVTAAAGFSVLWVCLLSVRDFCNDYFDKIKS